MRWNKIIGLSFILLLFVVTSIESQAKQRNFIDYSQLKGPYLGQKPPRKMPGIFAQGIISTDLSEGCSGWGNHMVEKTNTGWTEPKHVGAPINTEKSENRPYVSPDGKYFFYASTIRGNRDIYWMDAGIIDEFRKKAGLQSKPENSKSFAIVTYTSDNIQERSTKAFIKSVRELGREYRNTKIYIVLGDPSRFPCESLKGENIFLLPLAAAPSLLNYPLTIKAFAAAQVERTVKDEVSSLAWFDPATLVLGSLEELDLENRYGAAVRPVSLVNTIGIAPGSEPNDYWAPIYEKLGLDFKNLPAYETLVDEMPIQPYFNCEIFSVDPHLGIFAEWASLLTKFLKDENYQKNACTTFLRRLFLHQAVLSGVIISKVKPENIKPLSIKTGYPFGQHERLSDQKRIKSLNELSTIIFDYQWEKNPRWMEKIPVREPLKEWFIKTYSDYIKSANELTRVARKN